MKLKTFIFSTLIVLATALTIYQCEKPEPEKSKANAITALVVSVGSTDYSGTIAGTNITFANGVPYGTTEVTIKTFTISDKASATKKVGDKLNVASNTITVTAEDGSTQTYTVIINAVSASTEKAITAITFSVDGNSAKYKGTISGTNITANVVTNNATQATIYSISLSEYATANKNVGDVVAFSGGTITVTAQDDSTQIYSISINTSSPTPPAVSTTNATNVSHTSVTLNGEVTNTGNTPISGYGFIYSTTSGGALTLTGSGTKVAVGSSIEVASFTNNLTGLTASTLYYTVAYATNGARTSYGSVVSFTTLTPTPTTVNTTSAINVSGSGIFLVGNISDFGTGYSQVSQHGFVYGNSSISGNLLRIGETGVINIPLGTKSTLGNFNHTITTSLSGSYKVRAYATTSAGTTYGSTILSFNPSTNKFIGISTAAELQAINDNLDGDYFQLTDIDLSSITNFDPIGSSSSNFTGSYDGNGYVIKNLTIDRISENRVGLFGSTQNATLNNVWLENIDIRGNRNVGGLLGYSNGGTTLNNCSVVEGNIKADEGNAGGLIGYASYSSGITINNSLVIGVDVDAHSYAGGLVGSFYHFTTTNNRISNSYVVGGIIAGGFHVGGLIGDGANLTIENSYSNALIARASSNVGGVIGFRYNNLSISNLYWNTETSSRSTGAGGIGGSSGTTGRTSAEMLAGSSNYSGLNSSNWDFPTSSYPTLNNSTIPANTQSLYQAGGAIQLTMESSTGANFYIGRTNNSQRDTYVEASSFNTEGSELYIFDVNAFAANDTSRIDFWDCTEGTGDTILTTSAINGTSVTLQYGSGTTGDKTAWAMSGNCTMVRSATGSNPISGNVLDLEAVLSKGGESYTRRFKITFE